MRAFCRVRVLSIDGGGIRGLIPAVVLAEIERRTEKPAAELFDLIAGTSTGGILACSLTRPGPDGSPLYTAADLIELYESEGPKIFHRSLLRKVTTVDGILDERYSSEGLIEALDEFIGDARLSDALTPVLVTAYEIEDRFAFFFRSARALTDPTYDYTMADVAHATSAAPTYFEPARVSDLDGDRRYALIDGGVYAANPAACATIDVLTAGAAVTVLASLGTGTSIRPVHYEQARDWGQLGWARPLIDIMLSGAAETVDYQLSHTLGERYVRLQQRLEHASDDLDNASPENLRNLRAEGNRLVRENAEAIDDLCATLLESA
jgi:patatin-like phospholipase/acyl hydrolase